MSHGKVKVYFTNEITTLLLIKFYECLSTKVTVKVGVKI